MDFTLSAALAGPQHKTREFISAPIRCDSGMCHGVLAAPAFTQPRTEGRHRAR